MKKIDNEERRDRIMRIKKDCKLYVRMDYKNSEKALSNKDFQEHLDFVKNIANERYFVGGGFTNSGEVGGMVIFEATNLKEANEIFRKDPIIEKGFYRFEIFEWKVAVISEEK